MYYLGIDIGSLSCDAVLIDDNEKIISTSIVPTGAKNQEAIKMATDLVLQKANISKEEIKATISTGYGRERVEDKTEAITEITCHAKGIDAKVSGIKVLIDIGGQDSKVILLNGKGKVVDFAMNDKCAAGTGRFLEAMARALQVDINQLCDLDKNAKGVQTISSMCTVFAESEVVSLIANGVSVAEIASGLNRAIANRIYALVKRVSRGNIEENSVAMTGGVARNAGVVRALSLIIGQKIYVPDEPDTIGALGAALFARE